MRRTSQPSLLGTWSKLRVHTPDETEQIDGIQTRGKEEIVDAGNLWDRALSSGLKVGSQLLCDMQKHLDVLVIACRHNQAL